VALALARIVETATATTATLRIPSRKAVRATRPTALAIPSKAAGRIALATAVGLAALVVLADLVVLAGPEAQADLEGQAALAFPTDHVDPKKTISPLSSGTTRR